MASAKRITSTLLAIAIVVVAAAWRPAVVGGGRSHGAQGCQAAAPGGRFATIEAADVAGAVQHAASAPGMSSGAGKLATPAGHDAPVRATLTFPRPHDPRHLHAFSLLI